MPLVAEQIIDNLRKEPNEPRTIMKRIMLSVILLATGIVAFAQKSYVTVYCLQNNYESNYIYLSGDIPQSMKQTYSASDFTNSYYGFSYNFVGKVLNLLADNGYAVEQMNTVYDGSKGVVSTYLLSRSYGDSTPDNIQQIKRSKSTEVHEVARYNLQGMPISKEEKGIQIVVYSNYTTKTVIVE